jgi:hypothetical protein
LLRSGGAGCRGLSLVSWEGVRPRPLPRSVMSDTKPPQLRYERLPGESETDFSIRMSKIQAEQMAERQAESVKRGDDPLTKFRRVWGS